MSQALEVRRDDGSRGDLLLDETGVHFDPYTGEKTDVAWDEIRRIDIDASSTRPAKGSFRRAGLLGILTQREARAVITVAAATGDHVFFVEDDLDTCRRVARRLTLDIEAARSRVFLEGRPIA